MVSIVHYIHQDRLHLIICLIFILIMKIMELKYPLFCCWIVYSFDSFWIQFLSFLVLFFSSTFLRLFHWIVISLNSYYIRMTREGQVGIIIFSWILILIWVMQIVEASWKSWSWGLNLLQGLVSFTEIGNTSTLLYNLLHATPEIKGLGENWAEHYCNYMPG